MKDFLGWEEHEVWTLRFLAVAFAIAFLSSFNMATTFQPDKVFVQNNSAGALQNYTLRNNYSASEIHWDGSLAYDYVLNPAKLNEIYSFWQHVQVEWWKVPPSTWVETVPSSAKFFLINNSPDGVTLMKNMTLGDGGQLNVSYVLAAGAPVKWVVVLRAGQTKQYRLVFRTDSPPSGSRKTSNASVMFNWANQHSFDYWDLYNLTAVGNSSQWISYYELTEDLSPPLRYKLFVNLSKNGVALPAGSVTTLDPTISNLPAQINTSNDNLENGNPYDISGVMTYPFPNLTPAITWFVNS